MSVFLKAARPLRGEVSLPGDKSLGHRALLLGTLAEGRLAVKNLSDGQDVASTRRCLEAVGGKFSAGPQNSLIVQGLGLQGLQAPKGPLDCGNSGTTMRMLMGALCGQAFPTVLTGDASLSKRPMRRVAEPLRAMGAKIELSPEGTAPVRISPAKLKGRAHTLTVPSAQVKSSLLLAGLYAEGDTSVDDPFATRDHTERMLQFLSAGKAVELDGTRILLKTKRLAAGTAKSLTLAGDPSSAAFFAAAAALVPGSSVKLLRVLLNPGRMGFFDALKKMGGGVEIIHGGVNGREPVGDIVVEPKPLKALNLKAEQIPSLVDEIPILSLLAARAEGESRFEGLAELRVKESDRLEAMARCLAALGASARVDGDALVVKGVNGFQGAKLDALGDHRLAMTYAVAALAADGPVEVAGAEAAAVSYPGFYAKLQELSS